MIDGDLCSDGDCVCGGTGVLKWVVDYVRWRHQLLCNRGGLIYLEVEDEIELYDYVGDHPGFKGNPVRNAPPTPTQEDWMRCLLCNRLLLKSGAHHKYCPTCARTLRLVQKREWIRAKRMDERTSDSPEK